MKRHFVGILMLLSLGTISWGQGTKESFDIKKSREEFEIMQEILNTTLTFIAQNSPKEFPSLRFTNLSSFYLTGQGAVFVIPTSGFRAYSLGSSPFARMELYEQMSALSKEIGANSGEVAREASRLALEAQAVAGGVSGGVGSGVGDGTGGGIGKSQSVAPAPPEPPAPSTKSQKPAGSEMERERLKKAVEKAQAYTKKAKEEGDANRQKFLQSLTEVKGHLIEALATYGDSLSMVKPDEYVNLVLLTDTSDQRTQSEVISVRKSWITDYKAGKLNLESFKQKVIQYTE
ncbi:MAG: hypothetical protein ABSC60_03825 [Acidobacteriota bacterium]|jgi:hypothetical protein